MVTFWGRPFSVPAWLRPCVQSQIHKDMVWGVWCEETRMVCTEPWHQPYWTPLGSIWWETGLTNQHSIPTSVSDLTNVLSVELIQIPTSFQEEQWLVLLQKKEVNGGTLEKNMHLPLAVWGALLQVFKNLPQSLASRPHPNWTFIMVLLRASGVFFCLPLNISAC